MIELAPEALDAAGHALEGVGPVLMINLLRYRLQSDYGDGTKLPPCSGKEAYFGRYLPAFAKVVERIARGTTFAPVLLGCVHATLVAPAGEVWDDIAIIEYPSFDALRRIVSSADYAAEAAPHRRAALADWRFFAATKVELPG
ncbi:MAG: hypothetical protein ACRYGI_16095 [Janthinobacterium lividum]